MGFLSFLILAGLAILASSLISAAVLGVGVLLSRVFPVSVFEASIVIVATGAVMVWLLNGRMQAEEEEELEPEDLEEFVRALKPPLTIHPPRSNRKRKG